MMARRHRSNRTVRRARETAPRRSRALEEDGFDELDEWMAACPATDPPQQVG